jgi:hypothetical protein
MAADDINAQGAVNGRKIEVITYDNHSSASDSVRAFQRAVRQDKVVAVIGSYISEVVLALFLEHGHANDLPRGHRRNHHQVQRHEPCH